MATYSKATTSGNYTIYLVVNNVNQDIPNNRSKVQYKAYITGASGTSSWGTGSYTVSINGAQTSGSVQYDFSSSKTWYCVGSASAYVTSDYITHNSDGTKSINVSFSFSGASLVGSASINETFTLNTIPRASDVSVSNYSITNTSGSISATITSKANFYHKWRWKIGSGSFSSWTNKGLISTTSSTVTVANTSLLSGMPTSTSATFTIEVRTYSDSGYATLVGTKTATCTVSVNTSNIKPSVTLGNIALNTSPISGYAVAGYSTVKSSWSASGGYGTTSNTTYFTVSNGSLTSTSSTRASGTVTSNTIPQSASNYTLTINAYSKDSRGAVSDTVSKSITVYGYQPPTATLSAYRVADSTSTTEDGAGVYVYVTFSGAVRSSVNSQNSVQSTVCTYSGSISGTATNGQHIALADSQSATFTLTVTDKVTSSTAIVSISTAKYPLDLYDNGSGTVGASVGGTAVAGEFNSYIPFLTKNSFKQIGRHYIHNTSGTYGTDGYVRFAQFTVRLAYRSGIIHFLVSRRNRIPENVSVTFSGNDVASSTPTIYVDRYPSEYFMVKDSDGVFGLYVRKTEAYDQIDVLQYDMGDYMNQGVSILWTGTQVSSIPSGAIMGILYGGINDNFSYWHYANQTSSTELSASGIATFETKVAGDSSGVITYSGGIFTINRAGLYRIHAHIACQAITNNRVWLQLHNNSSTIAQWISYTSFVTVDMSKVVRADVGERIWIVATEATRINNGGIGPSFIEIEWIGD